MRRFILFAFIGVLLMKNAMPFENQGYPSHLAWLFDSNNKLTENKENNESEHKEENKPIVCQTQECEKFAQILSGSIDKSADPCDDFYEYACGKWPEHNPIPEGMDSWNMMHRAQVNVAKQIKEIFDEGPKDDDLYAIKLAKRWYAACMDTDTAERQGLQPIINTISRIGGWPMIMEPEEWNEEEYSWQKVDDQYMHLTGSNAFHEVEVWNFASETPQKMIFIRIPELLLKSYFNWINFNDSKEAYDESDEQEDSQELGSKDKSDNNNNDDDDNNNHDKDNNDNEDDDNDGDTNEQSNDENTKKEVSMKKIGKLVKNTNVKHSRKMKSIIYSTKHENYKTKKEKVKRRVIPTNVREKLLSPKNEKNHMKQARRERLQKILEATTPQISTENITDIDNFRKQYADYISKVARATAKARGVEITEKHMNKDIQDMIDFQIKLFHILGNRRHKTMKLTDLQEWYDKKNPKTANSKINWLHKIGEIFDEAHVDIDVNSNLTIYSNYVANLVTLLDETSSRTIVNYIHWNFLSNIIKTTTSEMKKLYYEWEKKQKNDNAQIFGMPKRLFAECLQKKEMRDIAAYEYVKNHFSDEITTIASDMLDDIQKEVEDEIKKTDWLNDDTKDIILAKLINMKKFIGYPDWYKNNTIVKKYFQGLTVINSYYENTLSFNRYSKWKSLRQMPNENDVLMISPILVNAVFDDFLDALGLSAADFQSPLFAYDRPQVINYGVIGVIMAHEVNHGFDNYGYTYNKKGKLINLSSAVTEEHDKRTECFVEQFNNYSISKESNYKINDYGKKTIGDNIADTMGLEAAFRAYKRRERECEKMDTVLPGHEDITNDQLFFLSFANIFCEDITNRTLEEAKSDMHSIGRLRVIGSVSNSRDFAKAYNCPVGSAMNPEKKCHVWK
ncbi:membrane metallo-endopeptidase-like 1 [Solenopsis invicta]|uniref:membrane metallo-endopeptidase-like 1 n=1 Tax=Solenopsis invicta TaxID=13686 RepID=UPI00193D368D|nr:membrane metallo-endopeptidase-like 1 [Solenopsis invicta]